MLLTSPILAFRSMANIEITIKLQYWLRCFYNIGNCGMPTMLPILAIQYITIIWRTIQIQFWENIVISILQIVILPIILPILALLSIANIGQTLKIQYWLQIVL